MLLQFILNLFRKPTHTKLEVLHDKAADALDQAVEHLDAAKQLADQHAVDAKAKINALMDLAASEQANAVKVAAKAAELSTVRVAIASVTQ